MSDKSDKRNKQDWNWNIIVALLSKMCQVFILDFHFEIILFYTKLQNIFSRMNEFKQNGK